MSTIKVDGIRSNSATSDAITLASDGTCTANITNNLSNRNILINGAMQVNQRGDLTGQTSSVYGCDRMRVAMGSAGTWSLSQSTDTPDGFANSMKLDCTTAKSSLDSGSFMLIQQKLEGQLVQAFAKGTSAAKQFAVSFYLKSNVSGTYTAEIQDNDNSRIASKTFTVSDGNWNRYSLIFPADTTGALDNDNNSSMDVKIWFVGGTNYSSGTVNTSSWAAKSNPNRVSSSNVNLASSTSNELYITGWQLEVGSVVTDFEHRSFVQELALCQRYFYMHASGAESASTTNQAPIGLGYGYTSTDCYVVVKFPVTMRHYPTMYKVVGTDYFRFAYNNNNAYPNNVGNNRSGINSAEIYFDTGASWGQNDGGMVRINSSAARLGFTAEL